MPIFEIYTNKLDYNAKEKFIAEATEVIIQTLDSEPPRVKIFFVELASENAGIAGKFMTSDKALFQSSIKILSGRSHEQKEQCVSRLADLVGKCFNFPMNDVRIYLHEMQHDHYSIGGKLEKGQA
jgi:4-oxalocrotonate tautomerase family enzyme